MTFRPRVSEKKIKGFRKKIWDFYAHGRRDFPWRRTRDSYRILVSELMLQQTQTQRVKEKYQEFLTAFPNIEKLANAKLPEVLRVWQGLGYNRRARFLLEAARIVVRDYDGKLPRDHKDLLRLPGVGAGTAGSLTAFVFNSPVVFIETNIRRVFIHEFFPNKKQIPDQFLESLILATLPKDKIREWYYALMDYGVYLAENLSENPNKLSRHYVRQSVFQGSRRQARGAILKVLLKKRAAAKNDFLKESECDEKRIKEALRDLQKEGIIKSRQGLYKLCEI